MNAIFTQDFANNWQKGDIVKIKPIDDKSYLVDGVAIINKNELKGVADIYDGDSNQISKAMTSDGIPNEYPIGDETIDPKKHPEIKEWYDKYRAIEAERLNKLTDKFFEYILKKDVSNLPEEELKELIEKCVSLGKYIFDIVVDPESEQIIKEMQNIGFDIDLSDIPPIPDPVLYRRT